MVAAYYCKLPYHIFRKVWLKITLLISIVIYFPLFISFSASIAYRNIWYPYISFAWIMIILWLLKYYGADLLDREYKKYQGNNENQK